MLGTTNASSGGNTLTKIDRDLGYPVGSTDSVKNDLDKIYGAIGGGNVTVQCTSYYGISDGNIVASGTVIKSVRSVSVPHGSSIFFSIPYTNYSNSGMFINGQYIGGKASTAGNFSLTLILGNDIEAITVTYSHQEAYPAIMNITIS